MPSRVALLVQWSGIKDAVVGVEASKEVSTLSQLSCLEARSPVCMKPEKNIDPRKGEPEPETPSSAGLWPS